jgi:hypothetical protein
MSEKTQSIVDIILTATLVGSGAVSTLDTIEQVGRIIALAITITSGIAMLLVNRKNIIKALKEVFNKCPE